MHPAASNPRVEMSAPPANLQASALINTPLHPLTDFSTWGFGSDGLSVSVEIGEGELVTVCGERLSDGGACEQQTSGFRRCYYHLKVTAGLLAAEWAEGEGLSEAERWFVGINIPVPPPLPGRRSVSELLASDAERGAEEEARLAGVRWLSSVGRQEVGL